MTSYYESVVFTKRSFLSVIRGYEVSLSVYLNFIKKNSAFVLKCAELSDLKFKKKQSFLVSKMTAISQLVAESVLLLHFNVTTADL